MLGIVGARPQFIKHAALVRAAGNKINLITVHTGQHFDKDMSDIFFKEFDISQPEYQITYKGHFSVESCTEKIIQIIHKEKPDSVLVYGDTWSTASGTYAAISTSTLLVHVEAGLRSYNMDMPEEKIRVHTDTYADLLFAPSTYAVSNLKDERIKGKIIQVGDIMKDHVQEALYHNRLRPPREDQYYYATVHRPYNVDHSERLSHILEVFNTLPHKVVFSIHPRTQAQMNQSNLSTDDYDNIVFVTPQNYYDNLSYVYHAEALLTDSGGMQKEAYWLKKKCITLRSETEWKETLHDGCNALVFHDLNQIQRLIDNAAGPWKSTLYGSGDTAEQIVDYLIDHIEHI